MKKRYYPLLLLVCYFILIQPLHGKQSDLHTNTFHQELTDTLNYQFALKGITGESILFTKFRNKVVLVNLWATWCGPCRIEMPHLQKLYANFSDPNFEIVSITLDKPSNLEKVNTYLSKNQFSFPVYFPTENLPVVLRVPAIPTTFLINQEGVIVWQHAGVVRFDKASFIKKIEKLLAKTSPE